MMNGIHIMHDINRFEAEFVRQIEAGYTPLDALHRTFVSLGNQYLLQVDRIGVSGFPLGAREVRGKFGDKIFAVRQGTQYVKDYKKPSNPRTARQQANRNKWKTIAQSWKNVSDAEKTEYNRRATGQRFSGFNLYVREQYRQ
ncbi:MAG: hypothetical protein N3A72_12070 [bacterium]|nr:hypothetical protein [bacterium]